MKVEAFLERLDNVHPRGAGKWSARCTGHPDKSPSLSIRDAGARILVHCFAGCETSQIVAALGLTLADLFTDSPTTSRHLPIPARRRLDLVDVAFQCELEALDRRLRAGRILSAATGFNIERMDDESLDRLLTAVARAYEDQERADFLETIADDFRVKAFQERTADHAA